MVNGEKFYATGALFAHFIHIGAIDENGNVHLAIAPRAAPGLTIIDIETVAAASVAVAQAKIASTEAALPVASKLIELAGSSATLAKHGLDRHWRNARTHTVHDPVRWKYRAVGDYWLNGVNPPRHGAI